MFDKIDAVVRRFETLTERLADPSLYDRADEMRQINQERKGIEPLVIKYRDYKKLVGDIAGNKEILQTEKDEDMREMAKEELAARGLNDQGNWIGFDAAKKHHNV